jgi:isoleucyl-tRNA synthetase
VTDFAGVAIKDADKDIIKNLKDRGQLFHQSTLVHSYPMCPRTDTPLIYRAMPQWYLAVEQVKDKMVKANQQITWVPETIKDGRFGKWLENARDWAISRSRVWGTPLPIWINDKTGTAVCMGSIADLKKYSGIEVKDLHREFVDDIQFTVPGEEGTYKRIPEVLDCWFESGAMPYAQLHYPFENQDIFKEGFPAEFIAEGLDQTRGWFYTLTVLSAALFDKPAFKNVIVNGMVLAKDGKKMSKRLRNYTPPDELIETFGADALRVFLINSGLVRAEELRFTDEGVKDMVRRALLPWYNSYKFFSTYAIADGWKLSDKMVLSENILDRWILSKLQTLIKNVNHEMQNYRLYNVVPELFNFIEDLTNWYIRLNRRRFWEEGMSADKTAAYSTLYSTLESVSLLMAPFTPFLADHIYQELKVFGGKKMEESVHLCSYPEANEQMINATLETAVGRMEQVILLGRQKRIQEGVKVKTPLKTLKVIHQDPELLKEIKKLEEFIKIELNIKNVEYMTNEADFVTLSAKPNSPVLGKKLGKDFANFRPLIEKLSSADVQKIEDGGTVTLNSVTFNSEEILVFRTAKEGTQAVTNRFVTIDLDCTLDQDLIDEGLAREIVSRIQKTRKDSNFNVSDRIEVTIHTSEMLAKVFQKYQPYISSETLMVKGNVSLTAIVGAMSHDIDEDKFEVKAVKA